MHRWMGAGSDNGLLCLIVGAVAVLAAALLVPPLLGGTAEAGAPTVTAEADRDPAWPVGTLQPRTP